MSPTDGPLPLPRVPTGVPGLDRVLQGGLLQGGTYILLGAPGAGKTILANQLCYHHVAHGGRALYVTLLAESHTRMLAHLRSMSFFTPEPLASTLHYVSAYRTLEREGLAGLLELLRGLLRTHRATLLVIDGLVSAETSATSELAFKSFIHELGTLAALVDCTTLMLTNGTRPQDVHPEHTMVDGLLELTDELIGVRAVRELVVRKFRGSDYLRGRHLFVITNDGLHVFPRSEAALGVPPPVPPAYRERASWGVPALDQMLGGGVLRGSTTLLLGPSGSGKTLLGLQFLGAGTAREEPGLFFGFYESPPRLLAKGDAIGLDLGGAAQRGLLEALWQPPTEILLDELVERLLEVVRRRGIRRLLIDGMMGFYEASIHPERVNRFLAAFTNTLRTEEVTTVFTEETRLLFGPEVEMPTRAFSALVENHLFVRQVEVGGLMRRAIAVLKERESRHDTAIREFRITDTGFHIDGTFPSAERVLTGLGETRGARAGGGARKLPGRAAKGQQRAKPPPPAGPKQAPGRRRPSRKGSRG